MCNHQLKAARCSLLLLLVPSAAFVTIITLAYLMLDLSVGRPSHHEQLLCTVVSGSALGFLELLPMWMTQAT